MPVPFAIPADGTDVFRNFVLRTGLTSIKYVRAVELRLDNTRVFTTQILFWIGRSHSENVKGRTGSLDFPAWIS